MAFTFGEDTVALIRSYWYCVCCIGGGLHKSPSTHNGLKIQFAFSYRANKVVPVRLIQDSNSIASAAYTLTSIEVEGVDTLSADMW